jgi:FG-GAP repeat
MPYIPNPLSGGFSNLAVGDINNDGWPDVVLTNTAYPTQNMYVLLNNRAPGWLCC